MPPLLGWQRRLLTVISCCLLLLLLLAVRLLQPGPPDASLPPSPVPHDLRILPYHERFEYLLNAAVCGDEPVRAVVVVHSDPRHPEVRQAIRESLPAEELAALGLRRAFMVADASTNLTNSETTIPQVGGRASVDELQQGEKGGGDSALPLRRSLEEGAVCDGRLE